MDELFSPKNAISYEKHKEVLEPPLDADIYLKQHPNFCHYQDYYFLYANRIERVNRIKIIKFNIECLYFIHNDFGLEKWDDMYWFFVGRLSNNLYFSYESGCCGTGFGLGSKSKIYISQEPRLLYEYGLTDKQRELILNKKIQFGNLQTHAPCYEDYKK